jgi:hypothetical protein
MTEYDDLERQLRRSVRARGAGAATGAGTRTRTRRRWFGLLAVPAVLAAGAAGAAGLVGGPGTDEAADRLVQAAVTATWRDPACRDPDRRVGARIDIPDRAPVDDAPLPQIARASPALAPRPEVAPGLRERGRAREAARALAFARRLQVGAGSAVLRGTERVARFPDGGRVLMFVSTSDGVGGPPDRAGCARARREHLLGVQQRAGAPGDDPVTARALVLLADRRDTAPGAQTVWLSDLPSRATGPGGVGSTGISVTPRGEVPTGVAMSSHARGEQRFVGLANPRTVRVVVRPAPGSRRAADPRLRRAVTRRFRTDQGVFAFTEPWPGAGPLVLTEYDAAGRVVARERLRR